MVHESGFSISRNCSILGGVCIFVTGFYQILTYQVLFQGKTSFLMKVAFITGILNLVLIVVLSNIFGMVGAIQAATLSFACEFIIILVYIQKKHGLPRLFFIKDFQH